MPKGRGRSIILRAFFDNDEAGRRTLDTFIKAGFQMEDMSVHYARISMSFMSAASVAYGSNENKHKSQPNHPTPSN